MKNEIQSNNGESIEPLSKERNEKKKILSIFGGLIITASLLSACGDYRGMWITSNKASYYQNFSTIKDCENEQNNNPVVKIAEGRISGIYYAAGCEYSPHKSEEAGK